MEKTENLAIKEKKTPKQKVFLGLRIAGNVLFYTVIIFLFLFSLMNINAGGKNGIPNLFGTGYLSVQSDSMNTNVNSMTPDIKDDYKSYGIGQFKTGDMVIVDILDDDDYADLKVGDVITFWDDKLEAYNTHRIVYLVKNEDGSINNLSAQGDKSVQMYGLYDPSDDSKVEDNFELEQRGEIQTFSQANISNIKGKVTDIWYGKGKVLDNIRTNWLWYFVLPVLVLLLFEVFMVVKNIMDLKGAKQKASLASDKDAMMAELAAEKERMRQELLAELAAQQANKVENKEEVIEIKEEPKEEAPVAEEVALDAPQVEVEEVKEEAVEAQEEKEKTE